VGEPPADFDELARPVQVLGAAESARGSRRPVEPVPLCWETGFTPAKRFQGGVEGWCFRTGSLGLGYYIDDSVATVAEFAARSAPPAVDVMLQYLLSAPPTAAPCETKEKWKISLDELVPKVPRPQCGGQRAVPRRKRFRIRKCRNGMAAPRPMDTLVGEGKRCTDHRDWGLWAFDSFNSNVASTGLAYLRGVLARTSGSRRQAFISSAAGCWRQVGTRGGASNTD
jgi:hypothetical protein